MVIAKLKSLNVNKAFGPDEIPPRILKECVYELSKPLTVLFKKSVESGSLPKDWKKATVVAIFKKGEKANPKNYRLVNLTCVICKVLESIIRDTIVNHVKKNYYFLDNQFGFRQGRSCVTQLLNAINNFNEYLYKGVPFDIIYLDFNKAFDTVPHKRTNLEGIIFWLKK